VRFNERQKTYAEPVRRHLSFLLLFSLAVAACGSGETSPSTTTASTVTSSTTTSTTPGAPVDPYDTNKFPTPTIFWDDCGESLKCGYVDVPVDYTDLASPETSLYIVRHAATDSAKRIGALLVNPGGPGFGGSYLAKSARRVYADALVKSFDIIGWDPRGTGQSIPSIDCIDDYDEYFAGGDITPDTDEDRQVTVNKQKEFTELCFEKTGPIMSHVGTNNAARDMEMIRRALGEETISYFGFSYGSELGAVWATLFPDTVRAAVFDGASDPNGSSREVITQQRSGFERSVNAFLAQCASNRRCSFHNGGDTEAAFDALMLQLDENPIPTYPDRPMLTRGMALTAVAEAMYSDQYWTILAEGLSNAQDGDGRGLMNLFDQYFRRQPDGTYENGLEAFLNISCADDPVRKTVAEADAEAQSIAQVSPRFSPSTIGDYTCAFWPKALDPRIAINALTFVPILVIGTTGDPATPLEGSRSMAQTLGNATLLVVNADQHIGYGANGCVVQVVSDYLVKLKIPKNEAPC